MRGLLQRVRRAAVAVDGAEVGAIQQGVLLLLGIAHADTVASADTLLDRVLRYRLFPDAQERMNLSLADIGGGLLIVSQFTLMADTRKGLRPSFTPAALEVFKSKVNVRILQIDLPKEQAMLITLFAGFLFRMLAIRFRWEMPKFVYKDDPHQGD